ncbi:uncharacterized protein LOC131265503 [Anopheles coustani]|uniref:uncharacterized protein LOC131265503 n=1 Tax=Anopheles coustani TaxID=139045 RepID=UPI002659B5A4|nr:uncharacterized protein LOC131265503 [Anopheles coustani]
MDVSDSFSSDELIPESFLESEWIDEDEVFAILKQWETRGGGSSNNKPPASTNSWASNNSSGGNTLINQSFGSDASVSLKQGPRFLDTGTFTRPKKRLESSLLNSSSISTDSNGLSSSSQHELAGNGSSPLLNVQIGGPVTPTALATSATGNRLLMQRSWLNDVSPPCSIMNSMEYSTNDRIMNSSSLITSGDFSSVGCLLNGSDDGSAASGLNVTTVANASYNGYNLYSVIEDRQRLENLCLDDESTLTKDCNISRTDLNAIESVSGVSTMQNSYESGLGKAGDRSASGVMAGSSKSSFEDDLAPQIAGDGNTTVTTNSAPANETFHMPAEPPAGLDEETRLGRTLINGGGTYDARRPRNFNTYRKPRSSLNQTFEGLPNVDLDACPVLPVNEHTFDGQLASATSGDKHTVMNSTFGIVGDEQVGGAASNGTFVRANRTITKDDVRLINFTQDGGDIDIDSAASSVTPPPAIPYGRTFKRRPRNGTFEEETAADIQEDSPLRPPTIGENGDDGTELERTRGQDTPNGMSVLNGDSSQLVQSTPFHGPYAQMKGIPAIPDISPISIVPGRKSITGGRNAIRRSRNLEHDLRNATFDAATDEPLAATDMLVDLETDDYDVQIRRLPSLPAATTATGVSTGGGGPDMANFLETEKRISQQHFELFERSIMESEHSGIDFDEMLESLTADVRRTGENDKLRQSLDNIKKRHSRINLEKQQQDEMKRKLHQQAPLDGSGATLEPSDNKLADSITKSMSSSNGSDRLLNRRSRYNEDVHLNLSPHQQQQQQINTTVTNGTEETPGGEADPASTASEVEAYDRKNRDRFKTIRLGRKRDDSLGPALPDVDQELGQAAEPLGGVETNGQFVSAGNNSNSSAFSKMDHNTQKCAGVPGMNSRLLAGGNQNLTMKTDLRKDEDDVFKKPQAIPPPQSGLVRPSQLGESRLRSTLTKPRVYGAGGATNPHGIGIQRKELTLPLGHKSSSTDCLEQREDDYFQQHHQEPSLQQQQQQQAPASRLATMSKLGGGSGGLIGTGRYSQFGLQNQRNQQYQQQQQSNPPQALKSPMGTKSKSYHSLTFGQSSGYGGSSSNLSKLHGSSALQLKLKHNSSNTELSGGVQMRTAAGGIAKTSRLGLVRPSSGYFSYSTHRKHPDSDNESINSLSSSSASSRGSLYRVDSQSIANNVQQPHLPIASATRTNSIEDVSGGAGAGGGGVSNGEGSQATSGGPVSLQPSSGLKQPTAGTGAAKPSGLRPPSAIRPPSVRSGLPRPTSYIRR